MGPSRLIVAKLSASASLVGCGSHAAAALAGDASVADGGTGDPTTCSTGALAGASYDIAKSRFAFGSTPVAEDAGAVTRWVGNDGALAINSSGDVLAVLSAGAPEQGLPDWSADAGALFEHVGSYYETMGVQACQIIGPSDSYAGGQTNAGLERGVGGVPVVESLAVARFETQGTSTFDAFYWPTIPANVVSAAIAFAASLSTPAGLAAYKAKLPDDAQGAGHVVIHHTDGLATSVFTAATTYDVLSSTDDSVDMSFDPEGAPVRGY